MARNRIKRIIKITLAVIVLFVVSLATIMACTNPDRAEVHKRLVAQVVDKYDMNKLNLTEAEREQYNNYMWSNTNPISLIKRCHRDLRWCPMDCGPRDISVSWMIKVDLFIGKKLPQGCSEKSLL